MTVKTLWVCPLCGASPHIHYETEPWEGDDCRPDRADYEDVMAWIECRNCGLTSMNFPNDEEAIEWWNRRPELFENAEQLLEKVGKLQSDLGREVAYREYWQEQAETVGKRYGKLVDKCKKELDPKPLTLDQIKVGMMVEVEWMSGERQKEAIIGIKNPKEDGVVNLTNMFGGISFNDIILGRFKLYRSKPEPNQVAGIKCINMLEPVEGE